MWKGKLRAFINSSKAMGRGYGPSSTATCIRRRSEISSPCRRSCSPGVPTPRFCRFRPSSPRAVACPAVSAACEVENAEPPPARVFPAQRETSAFAPSYLWERAHPESWPNILLPESLSNHPDPQHRPNPPCDVTREPGPQIPPARKTANACPCTVLSHWQLARYSDSVWPLLYPTHLSALPLAPAAATKP